MLAGDTAQQCLGQDTVPVVKVYAVTMPCLVLCLLCRPAADASCNISLLAAVKAAVCVFSALATGIVAASLHASALPCLLWSAEELYMLAEGAGLKLEQMAGMVLNPVSGKWSLSPSVAVNYIAYFSKISLKDKLSRGKPVSISKVADLASS